ncbi:MAG: Nif3-like dinuclear metal center hexameric protein [Clostridia bacterium]|nr:Nif3-like dinuclear metal center hexameric protein [Clostridia bacterium]
MKAIELIKELNEGASTPERTCDTIKAGNPERELFKVGVTMFATVDTVRQAKEWGADMLIVHEPTYYDHMEVVTEETPVILAKRALIEESGIVIYRYHDNMHFRDVDAIAEGELHYLGLQGKLEKTPYSASGLFVSDTPISALELAERMKKDLGIAHPRIAGARDAKGTHIATCFGTPKGVFELLCDDSVDIVLTGEACEWKIAEYARDAAALGMNKSLIVMGHIGSERDGMRLLAERMKEKYSFETRYFECGEVYTYAE